VARPRGRSFVQSKSARLTQWIGPADQGPIAVASGGATLIDSVAFNQPATIMRTRGYVGIRATNAGADATIVGAIGVAIVSEEAFLAGVASIPEPYTDADWGGWYVWRSFSFRHQFFDATGVLLEDFGFEVDSKAMRKVAPNEALVFIGESQQGAFDVVDSTRTLIKLP